MTEAPEIKAITAVLCDDIRREDNGKEIWIGVYTGSLLLDTFPSTLHLAFAFIFTVLRTGEAVIEVGLRIPGGRMGIVGVSLQLLGASAPNEAVNLSSPQLSFELKEAGKLEILWRIGGAEEWQLARAYDVSLKPQPAPSA